MLVSVNYHDHIRVQARENQGSLLRELPEQLTVGREYPRLGNEAYITALVKHREVPGSCTLKGIKDGITSFTEINIGWRNCHQFPDSQFII